MTLALDQIFFPEFFADILSVQVSVSSHPYPKQLQSLQSG